MACEIPPLIPFSYIKSISISINNSSFTFVNFKHASHDKHGANTN